MNLRSVLLFLLVLLSLPVEVQAVEQTFCFSGLLFRDGRVQCPTPSADGDRRGCNGSYFNFENAPDGYYSPMVGAIFEVWDRDPSGGDEYIGLYYSTGIGQICVIYEWDGGSQADGENYPDPYVIFLNKVQPSTGGYDVISVDSNWNSFADVSFRDSYFSNCGQVAGNCVLSEYMLLSTDITATTGARMAGLDTAQHALQQFETHLSQNVELAIRTSGGDADSGETVARHRIWCGVNRCDDETPAHEFGHAIQMTEFGQDGLHYDYSKDGNGGHSIWDPAESEYDSAATMEGWADYVAAVAWWDPGNSSSSPQFWGVFIEDSAGREDTMPMDDSSCSANRGYELQIARAFWDLDDANNETLSISNGDIHNWDDVSNYTTAYLSDGWDEFPNGYYNRDDWELGNHGVNAWDYYENSIARVTNDSDFLQTLVYLNCLDAQEYN